MYGRYIGRGQTVCEVVHSSECPLSEVPLYIKPPLKCIASPTHRKSVLSSNPKGNPASFILVSLLGSYKLLVVLTIYNVCRSFTIP